MSEGNEIFYLKPSFKTLNFLAITKVIILALGAKVWEDKL